MFYGDGCFSPWNESIQARKERNDFGTGSRRWYHEQCKANDQKVVLDLKRERLDKVPIQMTLRDFQEAENDGVLFERRDQKQKNVQEISRLYVFDI